MTDKIKVITQPANRIVINNPQDQIKSVKVVGATQVGTAGVQSLGQLIDVDTSHPTEGDTLVYDEATHKYVIKVLPKVDGGVF